MSQKVIKQPEPRFIRDNIDVNDISKTVLGQSLGHDSPEALRVRQLTRNRNASMSDVSKSLDVVPTIKNGRDYLDYRDVSHSGRVLQSPYGDRYGEGPLASQPGYVPSRLDQYVTAQAKNLMKKVSPAQQQYLDGTIQQIKAKLKNQSEKQDKKTVKLPELR